MIEREDLEPINVDGFDFDTGVTEGEGVEDLETDFDLDVFYDSLDELYGDEEDDEDYGEET